MIFRRIALVCAASLLLVSGSVIAVSAQQNNQGGSGLSITPTRFELTVNPGGGDILSSVTLTNVSGADVVAKAQVNDFEPDGTTGEPKIITDNSKTSGRSVKPFLTDVSDVPLKKGERKIFDIHVQIPKNAVPGAYYGIIRYTAVPDTQNTPQDRQVALNASVGTIVLLTIPGNVNEQLQVQGLNVYSGPAGYPKKGFVFISQKPNQIGVEVRNLGNGFAKPFGNVTVTNIFNKQVYNYEVNNTDPKANVLPDSDRTFFNDVKNISTPGRYTVQAFVSGTNGGQVISAKVSFWYLPLWFLAAIVGVIVLLVIIGWIIYRKFIRPSPRSRRH